MSNTPRRQLPKIPSISPISSDRRSREADFEEDFSDDNEEPESDYQNIQDAICGARRSSSNRISLENQEHDFEKEEDEESYYETFPELLCDDQQGALRSSSVASNDLNRRITTSINSSFVDDDDDDNGINTIKIKQLKAKLRPVILPDRNGSNERTETASRRPSVPKLTTPNDVNESTEDDQRRPAFHKQSLLTSKIEKKSPYPPNNIEKSKNQQRQSSPTLSQRSSDHVTPDRPIQKQGPATSPKQTTSAGNGSKFNGRASEIVTGRVSEIARFVEHQLQTKNEDSNPGLRRVVSTSDRDGQNKTRFPSNQSERRKLSDAGETGPTKQKSMIGTRQKSLNEGSVDWFFSDIDRESCEDKLRRLINSDGCFLVRDCRRGGPENPYTLSIVFKKQIFHIPIRNRTDNKFSLGKAKDDEKVFVSVADLVSFHKNNAIELIGDPQKGTTSGKVLLTRSPI